MEQKLLQILKSCKNLRELKQTHVQILIHGLKDSDFILPKLLTLSSELGFPDYAIWVFRISRFPNVVTYNTLIKCFIGKKHTDALRFYGQMKEFGPSPNSFTFTFLLKLFNSMPERNIVTWNSVLSGLSKAGNMEFAHAIFERMPGRNEVSWNSMISGYVRLGDVKSAQCVFDQMPEKTEPSNPSYLTLISNLSASLGHWKEALTYRVAMRMQGVEKVPGCSSIQVGNKVHEFLAEDTSHEERKDIYGVLYGLNRHLKQVCDGALKYDNAPLHYG
ncbi:hypothetical protein FEM48_Zijuj06G0199100 [Ziziphus jujuba var. spinosa]|uniref:Pentatricopeptide repeat-containing protein n=1 Tax=Ziziphus jujuba var. spinosa TaxID=714518 RepID=A0A978VBA8_ZIZJJ|nr:hypothetical protein FEM48_Zijuj06G0199100 [Ziziphus jujuba var. spinosa]